MENNIQNTLSRINVENTDEAVFVSCRTSSIDTDELAEIWSLEVQTHMESARGKMLILDFSGVRLLTSLFVGELIAIKYQTTGMNIPLGLCGMEANIREVFAITCLDRIFIIEPTRDETIARIKAEKRASQTA